jgi:hypothetical protein
VKVVKLTATARDDVEFTRKAALPANIGDDPDADLLDADEYQRVSTGSPEIVRVTDRLLSDVSLWEQSAMAPVLVARYHDYERAFRKDFQDTLVLYQDCLYDVRGHFTDDQRRLLVLETADKERQLFERLKAKFDSPESRSISPKRERIPEPVRIAVWRRDEGRCARCGSRERLEYDHIIPIDRGGSNTVRNVELLCERHNRAKSNNIE